MGSEIVAEPMLTIPGKFPSVNEYIRVERGNRYAANRLKWDWTHRVAAAAWQATTLEAVQGRVRIRCTWYCRDRRTDPDGVAGFGIKAILDGLVMAGVLASDGWKQVAGIEHRFEVDRENPRVEVELKEVGERREEGSGPMSRGKGHSIRQFRKTRHMLTSGSGCAII